jgi:lipoprotein NlpD
MRVDTRKSLRCALAVALAVALLAGCASRRPAPVAERLPQAGPAAPATGAKPAPVRPAAADVRPEFYTVRQGDTLYSIALDHGLDYREVAAWNNIDPARIRVGQQLRLSPPPGATVAAPLKTAPGAVESRPLGAPPPAAAADGGVRTEPRGVRVPYSDQALAQLSKVEAAPAKPEPRTEPAPAKSDDDIDWMWPTAGRVIAGFSESANLKGLSIAGKPGQPVLASAAGRVVYSGSGLRGYGKLVIIKHNQTFLSVYAHNSELLVKEGQTVSRGQKIAEMGSTDSDQVKLHFEIRRFGKPIDPIKLLPDRPA